MLRYTWIVFGAVACGTATAAAFGGVSSFGVVLTLATLGVALVATALALIKRQPHDTPVDTARLERQRVEQERFDQDLLARVHELVSELEIDWLRRKDFDGPWRDTPISSLRNFKDLDGLVGAPFGGDLGEAVARLIVAINMFVDYYEINTRPDALLTGTEWREIGPNPAARERPDAQEPADSIRKHLVERAAQITRAYDALVDIQSRALYPVPGRTRV